MPTNDNRQARKSTRPTPPDPDRLARAVAQVDEALGRLTMSRLRFVLRLEQDMPALPDYYGSMLRGGLGVYFRRLVCVQPQVTHCRDCALLHQCAFPYVFETPLPPHVPSAAHLQQVSPYLLSPVTGGGDKPAGTWLEFDLTLFGRAVDYLPYFIISYRQLGEHGGLGRGRVPFKLAYVFDQTPGAPPRLLYAAADGTVNIQPQRTTLGDLTPVQPDAVDTVVIRALTPMRIKAQERITMQPPFRALCAALLRRLSQLVLVHAQGAWEVDGGAILTAAAAVQGTYTDVTTANWERYSTRQGQHIRMDGALGCMTYQGELQPFLPLLWAGRHTHVGRGSTFGNGRYEVYVHA